MRVQRRINLIFTAMFVVVVSRKKIEASSSGKRDCKVRWAKHPPLLLQNISPFTSAPAADPFDPKSLSRNTMNPKLQYRECNYEACKALAPLCYMIRKAYFSRPSVLFLSFDAVGRQHLASQGHSDPKWLVSLNYELHTFKLSLGCFSFGIRQDLPVQELSIGHGVERPRVEVCRSDTSFRMRANACVISLKHTYTSHESCAARSTST